MKTKSILVIGMGRFGQHVAKKLNELGHEVMAVDNDEARIQKVMPFTIASLIGDCTDEDFLKSLGIDNFDVCIVAIGDSFQASLETTSLLKELGAKTVVSRATKEAQEKFLLRNGADHVVYPEKQLAIWTAICYSSEQVFDYFVLNDDYAIFEVAIPEEWCGREIAELDVRKQYGINILALKKEEKLYPNVRPNTKLTKDYHLLVLGEAADIEKCFHI